MMSGDVVSWEIMAFRRGYKAFKEGQPGPARPDDDDPCTSPRAIEWLGWMMGRADDLTARQRTRRKLGLPDED